MQSLLKKQIERECHKLIQRHHLRVNQRKKYEGRYRKRTGLKPGIPTNYEPSYWSLNAQFNPYHVRANAESIAYTIARKIRARTYRPFPALTLQIPKLAGGTRGITIFPIPDAAVSNHLFRTFVS
jgi:hypothetical protein